MSKIYPAIVTSVISIVTTPSKNFQTFLSVLTRASTAAAPLKVNATVNSSSLERILSKLVFPGTYSIMAVIPKGRSDKRSPKTTQPMRRLPLMLRS